MNKNYKNTNNISSTNSIESLDSRLVLPNEQKCVVTEFLKDQSNQQKQIYSLKTFEQAHFDTICAIDYSPDSSMIISGSKDSQIKIWESKQLRCIHTIQLYELETILTIKYSPNGKLFASGDISGNISIFNSKSFENLHTLKKDNKKIKALCFSKCNNYLISGSDNKLIIIWNLKTMGIEKILDEHKASVLCLSMSRDGRTFASGSEDTTIKIWNFDDFKCIHTLQGHTNHITSLKFSPNSDILVSTSICKLHSVIVWEFKKKGPPIQVTLSIKDIIHSVDISPNGKYLVCGSFHNVIFLWSFSDLSQYKTISGHYNHVKQVTFSNDNKYFASASSDQKIKIWDIETQECVATTQGHKDLILSVAISPDQNTFVSIGQDKIANIWDMKTASRLGSILDNSSQYSSPQAKFSLDSKYVFISIGTSFHKYSVKPFKKLNVLVNCSNGFSISPKFNLLAIQQYQQSFKTETLLINPNTMEIIFKQNETNVDKDQLLEFSADESLLFSKNKSSTITILDIRKRKVTKTLRTQEGLLSIKKMQYLEENNSLCCYFDNRYYQWIAIKVWSCKNFQIIRNLSIINSSQFRPSYFNMKNQVNTKKIKQLAYRCQDDDDGQDQLKIHDSFRKQLKYQIDSEMAWDITFIQMEQKYFIGFSQQKIYIGQNTANNNE